MCQGSYWALYRTPKVPYTENVSRLFVGMEAGDISLTHSEFREGADVNVFSNTNLRLTKLRIPASEVELSNDIFSDQ